MEFESKFKSNYLSKKHYQYGLVTTIVFLFTSLILSHIYWRHDLELSQFLSASPSKIYDNSQYWRLFTSAMIHADLSHFLSNSLFLALMGYFVASYFGWIAFPLITLLMGGVTNYIVIATSINDVGIVGASGMVYFLWGFWLALYLFIERHIALNRRFMKIIAISLLVLVPTTYQPQTSYFAHGIGFLIGVVTGILHFSFNRKYFQSFEKFEIVVDKPPDFNWHDPEVDDDRPE